MLCYTYFCIFHSIAIYLSNNELLYIIEATLRGTFFTVTVLFSQEDVLLPLNYFITDAVCTVFFLRIDKLLVLALLAFISTLHK